MTISLQGVHIEWVENPLASRVALDDYGKLRLRYGIARDIIGSAVAIIQLARDEPKNNWLDSFRPKDDGLEEIERIAAYSERELLDVHEGDCTCVPTACLKCQAEEYLGITTTVGLGKSPGHHVAAAYAEGRDTLAAALHWLEHAPLTADWKGWEAHAPRWAQERADAAVWLRQYAADNGFKAR